MTTSKQVIPNPSGKGGFGDNPQNRSNGHWDKEQSIPYQMNKMLRMGNEELAEWYKENKKTATMAQLIAYQRVINSVDSLPEAREVIDRTSGKAKETIEHTIVEAPVPLEDLRDK